MAPKTENQKVLDVWRLVGSDYVLGTHPWRSCSSPHRRYFGPCRAVPVSWGERFPLVLESNTSLCCNPEMGEPRFTGGSMLETRGNAWVSPANLGEVEEEISLKAYRTFGGCLLFGNWAVYWGYGAKEYREAKISDWSVNTSLDIVHSRFHV